MNKNFGEWYRLVSLEPNGETIKKRWAAVEEWASTLRSDAGSILETVRIFQELPPKNSREEFLSVLRKHDPAFPQRNELELRVLAGASLAECMNTGDDEGDDGVRAAIVAGTAVGASSLRVPDSRLSEVTGEVLEGLQSVARTRRKRTAFDTNALGAKTDAAAEAMKQVAAAGDWNQLKTNIQLVLQSLIDAIRRAENALTTAAHNLRCADEETNILWWLEGGCSRDLNKPWSALPKEAVPLIAAKELADLTDAALGPQDAAALLHRVVTNAKCKETSIQAYVNAVPDDWAKAFDAKAAEGVLDLAPLSLALSHRGKSGTSSWQQFFDATSGVSSSNSLAPDRVARQAYIEALLLRTLAEKED